MEIGFEVSTLTHDDLTNILETACYGSNWLAVDVAKDSKLLYKQSPYECYTEKLADVLLKGGNIVFKDLYECDDEEEDDDECKVLKVDYNKISSSINSYLKKYPKVVSDILEENDDYYTWNEFIQFIMYGEVVYG